jgi:hypothetical protein
MALYTGSTGSGYSEKVRITHAGDVGIGTTDPQAELDVAGTVSATAFVGDGSGLTNIAAGAVGAAGSDKQIQFNDDGDMAGASNLYWDETNDRLGIGTASPATALDVSGTITAKVFSSVPGGSSEAFGLGATIDGNYALAVGRNAQTAMNSTTAIGHEASATQTNAVALGKGAGAHSIHTTALGTDTSVSGNYSTAVGSGATVTNLSAVAIGAGAQVSGNRASAFGTGANASGAQSLAIGTNSNAAHDYSIVIAGRDGASTANQQFVVGSDTARITTAYIGRGVSSAIPSPAVTINATGGNGTDIAATDLVLAGGRATGNAAGGDVLFQTSDAGSSGSTLQSLTTKMAITAAGDVGIGTTEPTSKLDVDGTVTATAFAGDGSQLTGVTADSVTISGTAKQLLFNSDGSTLDHADNLYWNQATDFLGIGTDSPISTLHLVHTINNGYADPVLTVDGSVGAGDYLLAVRGAGDPSTATYDNTIFSVVGDGRVGVRAIDPSATFHIVGKATGYPDNAFLVDGHGGTTDKLLEARGSGTSRFVVMGDGKVGIGAPAPATALDVVGTVSATAFVGDGSQLTNIAAGAVGAAGSDTQIQFNDDGDMAGASNLYWDETNDRLGIGTSAPTGRLFVTGAGVSSPGNASLYYGALAPLTVATQSYNILEMVTASNNPVHSAGPVSVRARGTLDSPTVPSEGDYVGGYAGAIWDGNSVNTTDTAKVVFKVDGSVSNEVAPQRIEFMTSETNASGLATRLVVKADGKVGVGVADPDVEFEVNGDAKIVGNVAIGSNFNPAEALEVNGNIKFRSAEPRIFTGGPNTLTIGDVNDKINIVSHVGFGTADPSATIHLVHSWGYGPGDKDAFLIDDTSTSGGDGYLKIFDQAANAYHFTPVVEISALGNGGDLGVTYRSVLDDGSDVGTNKTGNAAIVFEARESDDSVIDNSDLFKFRNYDQVAMTIDATGQVGIGTEDPAATLDVSGTIHATQICDEGGANCKDISGGWGSATNLVAGNTSVAVADTGSDGSITFTTEGTQRMVIDEAGYVGIGVDDPLYNLDVYGSNSSTSLWSSASNLRIANSNGTDNTWAGIAFSDGGSLSAGIAAKFIDTENNYGELHFAVRGADGWKDGAMVVKSAGNVGIGIATPDADAKLDVAGAIKVASNSNAEVCDEGMKGAIRFNSSTGKLQVCK